MAGNPKPLSADDAAILRLESERILGHTLKLAVLEPGSEALDAPALREAVGSRLDRWPRASDRVEETAEGPAWVAADVDLAAHVRGVPAPGDDEHALWRAAGQLMATRLDHSRPLWALDVVGPIGDGRQAVVARIHHAMADGMTCIRVLDALVWDELPAEAPAPQAGSRHAPPANRGKAGELVQIPGAVWRELCAHAPRTPFAQPIGGGREVAFAGAPLSELRRIGHSAGEHVTVNDVLLAAVAGGLRNWLAGAGTRFAKLRAQVPVSLHHRDETAADAGNRDSFLNVDLPLAEDDPVRRLLRISAETARRKRLGDAAELYDLFHALSVAGPPGRAAEHLLSGPGEFSLSISNVPGPRGGLEIAGRRVESLGTIAEPANRHALRVSALSCGGELRIGFCSDPDAVPGVEALATATEEALAELRIAAVG